MSFESSPGLDRPPRRSGAADGRGGPATLRILGGGVAGLAVGFYAGRRGLPFTVHEAARRPGGLCVTFRQGDFLFDSGAHRLHDRDPEITRDVRALLGGSLREVDRPSMIFDGGRFIRFPFEMLDILRHLGPRTIARGALDLLAARIGFGEDTQSFAGLTVRRYGRTFAEQFLLSYSSKLWGLPCELLSPRISGGRLRGLGLRQFLAQTLLRRGGDWRSAEGAFYYPSQGIGMLTDALARACGPERIHTQARVSKVHHQGGRIRSIEVGGERLGVAAEEVVSTLPVDRFISMLDPPPPSGVLELNRALRHRNLVLVALFLRKARVTGAATVYFPGRRFPFTRVTEPRNRSELMCPPGHTSLVAEVPCDPGDALWSAADPELIGLVGKPLEEIGWIREGEVLGSAVVRLEQAYPVLSLELERSLGGILRYLAAFGNLRLAGRNGRFEYGWIHDMLRSGKDLVDGLRSEPVGTDGEAALREAAS